MGCGFRWFKSPGMPVELSPQRFVCGNHPLGVLGGWGGGFPQIGALGCCKRASNGVTGVASSPLG